MMSSNSSLSGATCIIAGKNTSSTTTSSSTTTQAATTASTPHLPLDWTQISRRGRNRDNDRDVLPVDRAAAEGLCCNDRNCRRRRRRLDRLVENAAANPSDTATAAVKRTRTTEDTDTFGGVVSSFSCPNKSNNNHCRIIAGTAVLCLTDPDVDWFQGYLFVSTSSSSFNGNCKHCYYGLLGRIQEIDECLQCAEGGYRELSLQVTEMGQLPANKKEMWEFPNIAWTGGDMMRLRTITTATTDSGTANELQLDNDVATVFMDADRVETGRPANERIQELFGSLLRRLRQEQGPEDEDRKNRHDDNISTSTTGSVSVTDLMPNAAVVTGRMELRIPNEPLQAEPPKP